MGHFIDYTTPLLTFALLISNFLLMLSMWINKIKAPEDTQNERIEKLEKEMTDLKLSLEEKDSRVLLLEEGTVIIQRSLLALMSHAINGNDIAKLQSAKNDLEEYLTARR